MAKFCPIYNKQVLYLECLECKEKNKCKNLKHEKKIDDTHSKDNAKHYNS